MRLNGPRGSAAAATVLVLLLSACASSDKGSLGDGSAPATTSYPSGSLRSIPENIYKRPSRPAPIAGGVLVQASLDGSAVFAAQEDDRFGDPGCEGAPEPVLFRQPVDGGARQLLGDGKLALNGMLIRSSRAEVALVQQCEGFFTGLLIGTETAEGRLEDMKALALELPGDSLPSPGSFAWSADGSRLLAAPEQEVAGGALPGILEIDPGTGAVRRLFDLRGRNGITQVSQAKNGAYLVAAGGKVTFHDDKGVLKETYEGRGFSISPDGRDIAVFGRGLTVVPADGVSASTFIAVPEGQIASARFSPDGRGIACVSAGSGSDSHLWVITPEDQNVSIVAGPAQLGRAYFSGDGKKLLFNEFTGVPDFASKVVAISFG
ncbi:MAG: hypothetical protein ACRDV9_02300 [Acidimicrobiia bacterium]